MQQICLTDDFVSKMRHHDYHSLSMVCWVSHIMLKFFGFKFLANLEEIPGLNAHFNPIPTRLFCAPKTKGEGGGGQCAGVQPTKKGVAQAVKTPCETLIV